MIQQVLMRVVATNSWCHVYIFHSFIDQVDTDLIHLLRAFMYYILSGIDLCDHALRCDTIAVQELVDDILGRGYQRMMMVITAHITL